MNTGQSEYLAGILEKLKAVRTGADLEAIAHDLIYLQEPNLKNPNPKRSSLKETSFVPLLCQFLEESTDTSLILQAIYILAEIKPQSVVPKFHHLLTTTEDYRLKLSLLNGLFSFADPETLTYLPRELKNPDSSIRSSAISVIHSICTQHPAISLPTDLTELLVGHLKDANLSLRSASASILVRFGHSAALETLADLVAHPNPIVRLQALASLALCSDSKALAIAAICLDDPDSQVQITARHIHQALVQLQGA